MSQSQEGNEPRTVLRQGVGVSSLSSSCCQEGRAQDTDGLPQRALESHLLSTSGFQRLPFCLTHDQFLPVRLFASPEEGGGKTKRNETQKLSFELKTQNKGGAEGLEGDRRA